MKYNLSDNIDRQKAKTRFEALLNNEKNIELKEVRITRSSRQNSALHLYFTFISDELNEMGTEFTYTGVKGVELSTRYTAEIVKNFFWRPIQITLFDIESTTKIDTNQINQIIDIVSKFFSEKGVEIAFPSFESLMEQDNL